MQNETRVTLILWERAEMADGTHAREWILSVLMSVEFHSCCERACDVRGKGCLTLHKLRASSCGYGMEPVWKVQSNRAPET